MTSKEEFLTDIKLVKERHKTFGDDRNRRVILIGTVNVPEMLKIEKVLLVKGLHVNLINISQICDDDVQVKFTKRQCLVVDKVGNNLMKGTRSSNNYYLVDVPKRNIQCFLTKQADLNLSHRKIGHLNIKNLLKVARQGSF